MKIRIKGNSLRLRLSQSEVEHFLREGKVSDSIRPTATLRWTYALEMGNGHESLSVHASETGVSVMVPRAHAAQWASSDEVSIESQLFIHDETLMVLVEKDFACLADRPNEDERDMFPNPLAAEGKKC